MAQKAHHYRYIRKDTPTGFVMTWTAALAGRNDMVECTRDGTPLRHIAPVPTAVIPKAIPVAESAPAKKPFVIPEGARVITFGDDEDEKTPEPAEPTDTATQDSASPAPVPVAGVVVPPAPAIAPPPPAAVPVPVVAAPPAPVTLAPAPPAAPAVQPAPLPATFEHMPKRALIELATALGMPAESTTTTNRNILKQRIRAYVEDLKKQLSQGA